MDASRVKKVDIAPIDGEPHVKPPLRRRRAAKKTAAKKTAAGPSDPIAAPRQGHVGVKLASGEVVLTASGRETTPFPRLAWGRRASAKTLRAVDAWLLENAAAEACARGDDFNAQVFEREARATSIPSASKDSAEEYLFGQQPPVVRSLIKPVRVEGYAPADERITDPGALRQNAIVQTASGDLFIVSYARFDRLEGQPFTPGERPEMSRDAAVSFDASLGRNPESRQEPVYDTGFTYDGNWRDAAWADRLRPRAISGNRARAEPS